MSSRRLHPHTPRPQLRYDRWQFAWSTNCSTRVPSSASRGGPHRNRTHASPCASLAHTPNKSWHSAAPSSPSSHDRGAPHEGSAARHRWHVSCSGRSWSRCSRSSASPTSRSVLTLPAPAPAPAPIPSPSARHSPQIDRRRVRARRAVEGAHAAQHARCGRERAQPARLVVSIRMLHKLVPQLRAQVRPHLPGEARARGAHKCTPALRGGAPPRETRERGRGGCGGGGWGRV